MGHGDGVPVGRQYSPREPGDRFASSTPSTRPRGPDAVRNGPKSKMRPPTSSEEGDEDAGTHEQEIRRLQIAVHDALVVDRLDGLQHLLPS